MCQRVGLPQFTLVDLGVGVCTAMQWGDPFARPSLVVKSARWAECLWLQGHPPVPVLLGILSRIAHGAAPQVLPVMPPLITG